MDKNKINLITLGCSKNSVDSEKLLKQLQSGGYNVMHDSENSSAGTVIINTCGLSMTQRRRALILSCAMFVKKNWAT